MCACKRADACVRGQGWVPAVCLLGMLHGALGCGARSSHPRGCSTTAERAARVAKGSANAGPDCLHCKLQSNFPVLPRTHSSCPPWGPSPSPCTAAHLHHLQGRAAGGDHRCVHLVRADPQQTRDECRRYLGSVVPNACFFSLDTSWHQLPTPHASLPPMHPASTPLIRSGRAVRPAEEARARARVERPWQGLATARP